MKLAEFKLERYFARYEFDTPFLLSSSDIEPYTLPELLELADPDTLALWRNLSLGYTESAGNPLLRAEIAALYDDVSPEEVLVFSGAEEAIFSLSNVLLGPGEHAVVLQPAYQSLYEVGRATGADVSPVRLQPEEGWQLNLGRIETALRPTTRLLVLNFPHNPTGALPTPDQLQGAVQLAREREAHLLSDEVYRGLEYDPGDRLPAAVELYERGVSLGVMSKAWALAGLRIGWIVTHDSDLLRRLAAFKDYTTICNSAPSEILALIALRAAPCVLERNRAILRENLSQVDAFFARWPNAYEWVRPRAGCIAFPRLTLPVPIEEFCSGLLQSEGVMLLPGTVYEQEGNFFRLGWGRRNLPAALSRLHRYTERCVEAGG
ncbi:MAG: aminotransferase class I/II-fold pyridoxal phosphate-dependent enzyme [Chloroflexota bacterium]|nr:aminotransferase class I/II-fold pyridoxal phosphate-dependent enzyme [Chloroflexota bacterium]